MAGVVVVGSINMDLSLRSVRLPGKGETILADDLRLAPGGKGANQAVAAARLGMDVWMVGRVGRDPYGEKALADMASSGVDTTWVVKDPDRPTGVAVIVVDAQGANTIVVYQGANAQCTPAEIDRCGAIIKRAQALVTQLEVPLETVDRALAVARPQNVTTVLNPAPAREIPTGILANVDFLIPNEHEASLLSGVEVTGTETAFKAARALNKLGPRRVVITLGEAGAVFIGPEGEIRTPALKVGAIDSTAAGDAFIAAFTFAWTSGMGVEKTLRYACAAGAVAATKPGAQSALPTNQEIIAAITSSQMGP